MGSERATGTAMSCESKAARSRRSVLAEVESPQRFTAERIFDELAMALRAEIETESLRAAVFDLVLSGRFHFLNHLGEFLQVIRVEVFLVERFGIKRRIHFELHDKPPISQLLPAQIAREVQHD
jgi:hypothetical protein